MWNVCDVLYALLYISVNCFVVRGCAVSNRYINVCKSGVFTIDITLQCTQVFLIRLRILIESTIDNYLQTY